VIICVCHNISTNTISPEGISRKKYEKIMNNLQCGTCKDEWKKLVSDNIINEGDE